jgi:phosphoribosyl 1,2-cyclic phosphodiesterase
VTENVKQYILKSTHLILEANYDEEMLRQGRYPEILKERIVSGHGHLSNKKAANALAENFHEDLKNVWLCHLSEENNHPELARKTVETVLRSYGIIAGVDFSLDVLRRKIPTGPFELGEVANRQYSLPFEG